MDAGNVRLVRSATRSRVRAGGNCILGLLLAVALAPCVVAQGQPWPFPGSPPTKLVSGDELTWNGSEFQTPPGSDVVWTIHVINDGFAPAIMIYILDDIPDPSDGYPVAPFDFADIIEQPVGGTLDYFSDDWLNLEESPLYFGDETDLIWVTHFDDDAEDGTLVCNRAFITYLEADANGNHTPWLPQRWFNYTLNQFRHGRVDLRPRQRRCGSRRVHQGGRRRKR